MLVVVLIVEKDFVKDFKFIGNVEVVMVVGKVIVECVFEKGIKIVVFDCSGF